MYTVLMVKSAKRDDASILSSRLFVAFILVVMAVSQLFTFDGMAHTLAAYGLAPQFALVIAVILVCVEVFALPWLLPMKTGKLMGRISLVCGLLAWAIWITLGIVALASGYVIANAGLLGVKFPVPLNPVVVMLLVALLLLHLYLAYRRALESSR